MKRLLALLLCFLVVAEPAFAAITYIGAGAAATDDGGTDSISPGYHASTAAGDFVVAVYYTRDISSSTCTIASGWTQIINDSNATAGGTFCIYYRFFVGGDASPQFDVGGLAATDSKIAQTATWRGIDPVTPVDVTGTLQANSGNVHCGPAPGVTLGAGDAVIVFCGKRGSWASVAPLTGDSLTWAEIGEPDEEVGSNAALVWNYAIDGGSGTTATDKTYVVTTGENVTDKAVMITLNAASSRRRAPVLVQ